MQQKSRTWRDVRTLLNDFYSIAVSSSIHLGCRNTGLSQGFLFPAFGAQRR